MKPQRILRFAIYAVLAIVMGVPLALLVTNAFKSQQAILDSAFGWPEDGFSFEYILNALTTSQFNVVAAYAVTIAFVIAVNVVTVGVCGPAAYALARGTNRFYPAILLLLLLGLFIPSQALVIPVIYVLRTLGLMGTVPGFILFESTVTIPLTIFLFTAYIRSIPRDLDEAATIDGASKIGTYWRIIFPLMSPAVATAVVLNAIGVWADFVNPQIILGTGSGIYTVTTGVYRAISQYSTNYEVVYPTLLLATAPMIIFFIVMQKRIVSGLTAGAIKS